MSEYPELDDGDRVYRSRLVMKLCGDDVYFDNIGNYTDKEILAYRKRVRELIVDGRQDWDMALVLSVLNAEYIDREL